MPGRQAKLISPSVLQRMLGHVRRYSPTPLRDRVMILLSVRAGPRAAEIAKLTWPMVLDARGRVDDMLVVIDRIAKKRGGRRIPLHTDLRSALVDLRRSTVVTKGPVVLSSRGGGMKPNSIVNWFVALFAVLDIEGCSSHSGRRTFITQAAPSTPGGLQPARCATSRRASVDRNHAAVYRRRHAWAAPSGRVAVATKPQKTAKHPAIGSPIHFMQIRFAAMGSS